MPFVRAHRFALSALSLLAAIVPAGAMAQSSPFFAPGNLVVFAEGCGVQGGTCTSVANGTGTGTLNSSAGGYGDNQGAPVTLFQYKPNGTASVSYVNSLVLPQAANGGNFPLAGEYGSSSEGHVQLSGQGQYLTFMGYGINAATFDANPTAYGAAPSLALAQSGSLTGQSYAPVPRVVALVDPNGNVNTSTAIYNVFNLNNPRSVYTQDGLNAYISGQGTGQGTDATGGVFYTPLGGVNNAPIAITGLDTTGNTLSQDTRVVQIYNNTLYVSVDTKGGSGSTRSYIGTLGTPPATSLYKNNAGPTQLVMTNNTGTSTVSSNGKLTLTAAETNGINHSGDEVNLSPAGYFFANAYTLYIADTGYSKQTSAKTQYGDGGLQKWVNTKTDGSGTWQLLYTMSTGLPLVPSPNQNATTTSGMTGLYSIAGVVNGTTVSLYAVNYNINDLDQTYLYGITDTLSATTNPSTPFTQLAVAPADTNFKGVSLAPTYPAGSATILTSPLGLTVATSGTGCVPGTYVTPVTLVWTAGSTCTLSTVPAQSSNSTPYLFTKWQDNTSGTSDVVIASATPTTYTATFSVAAPAIIVNAASAVYGTASTTLTASIGYAGASAPTGTVSFTVNGSSNGVNAATCTGTTSPLICTATYNSSATAIGNYTIAVSDTATSSYVAATATGTLSITAATDFSFTNSGVTSQTASKGSSTSFAFSLKPTQASYPGTVSFNVSGLPSGSTYTFTPSSVTALGGAQTVTLNVQLPQVSANTVPRMPWMQGGALLAGLCVLPVFLRRRLRGGLAKNMTVLFLLCGGLAGLAGMTGCSRGTLNSSPVVYTGTVTATSGGVQHQATVTLTVQ